MTLLQSSNQKRNVNLTEWRWPNEDDQMNMTEFCEHDRNFHNHYSKHVELDRKNNKYHHKDEHNRVNLTEGCNNNKNSHNDDISVWIWPKIKITMIFGHIQLDMLVIVELFLIFSIFSQTHSFLVMFNKLTFVVVSFRSTSTKWGSSVSVKFNHSFRSS